MGPTIDPTSVELLREALREVAHSAALLAGRIETVERLSGSMVALLTARLEDLTKVVDRLATIVLGETIDSGLTVVVGKLRQSVEILSVEIGQIETKREMTTRTDTNMRRDAFYKYLVWLAGIVTLLVGQGLFLLLQARLKS